MAASPTAGSLRYRIIPGLIFPYPPGGISRAHPEGHEGPNSQIHEGPNFVATKYCTGMLPLTCSHAMLEANARDRDHDVTRSKIPSWSHTGSIPHRPVWLDVSRTSHASSPNTRRMAYCGQTLGCLCSNTHARLLESRPRVLAMELRLQ